MEQKHTIRISNEMAQMIDVDLLTFGNLNPETQKLLDKEMMSEIKRIYSTIQPTPKDAPHG